MKYEFKIETFTKDVLSKISRFISIFDSLLDATNHMCDFASDIDEGVVSADRVRADDDSFD